MEIMNQFQYVYENLRLYQFQDDWMIASLAIVGGTVFIVILYYALFFAALKSVSYHTDRLLAKKKKTLSDLILMKDIQTELEKEIEQAILKAAFHS